MASTIDNRGHHKTATMLDTMPKSIPPDATQLIHAMDMAPTLAAATNASEEFKKRDSATHPKAVECLTTDEDVLVTCYNFPAVHWSHLRTTNPLESTFATVRHRTRQPKGGGVARGRRRWRCVSSPVNETL